MFTDEAIVRLNSSEIEGTKHIKANTYFGTISGDGFYFKQNEQYIFTGKINAVIDTDKLSK